MTMSDAWIVLQIIFTYLAFAKAVERPTNRTARSVCDDMYLILETITCKHKVLQLRFSTELRIVS